MLVLAAVGLGLGAASGGARGSADDLKLALVTPHPAANSEYTFVVKGTTSALGWLLVFETSSRCPSRDPESLDPKRFQQLSATEKPVRGNFSIRSGWQLVGVGPSHLCAYLQPASIDNGQTSYSSDGPPLARAELVVTGTPRLPGRSVVQGHLIAGNYALALTTNASGTRFVSLMIPCGGPQRADGWYTKRFNAKISLPITKRLRWNGAVQPENGNHYEPPYPPDWFRPVHASFDLQFAIDDQGGLIRGIARLSGPGLPCPIVQHIKPNR